MPFVLRTNSSPWIGDIYDYFTGKTYVHQGETYANIGILAYAKRYKTKAGAQKAVNSLDLKVWNYSFHVHELHE